MNTKLKAVDFFCSGGGMSYGLYLAGIQIIAGIDIDPSCKETYEANIPNAKFINMDIKKLEEEKLAELIKIEKKDNNLVFVGCSPCQFWTIINTDKTKSEKSKNLLCDFKRFVNYYKPGYVIVENVPGILTRKEESGLTEFINNLEQQDYTVHYETANLNNYGVPQSRKRFSLIASRVKKTKIFPEPDNLKPKVKDTIGEKNGFPKICAGNRDNKNFMNTTAGLRQISIDRLKKTPKNGGNRLNWAETDLQLETYKKIGGNSFKDTYGRMYWDKPAPTITTKFYSISNGRFGHPEEDRALSLGEGAALQTFPKEFIFKTKSIGAAGKMIGNAVPPEFARRIGEAIIKAK